MWIAFQSTKAGILDHLRLSWTSEIQRLFEIEDMRKSVDEALKSLR